MLNIQSPNQLYQVKSRWKIYLAVAGAVIVLTSMLFTDYLVSKLKEEEANRVGQYKTAMQLLTNTFGDTTQQCDYTLHSEIISHNTTIPIILTDFSRRNILLAANFPDDNDTLALRKELNSLLKDGAKPDTVYLSYNEKQLLYYKNSKILTLLTYFPIFQLTLIIAFVGFGYAAFSAARRSEQNQVWVGMAKETAHQLGTPISALMGWVEMLKMTHEGDEMTQETVNELEKDVARLQLVAERFSKIGSAPELETIDLHKVLQHSETYMSKRTPRKVRLTYPPPPQYPFAVRLNVHLFDWVLENLIRNAIDALEGGEGRISIEMYQEPNFICLDISDSGKGIPHNRFKDVFRPGYSTKKRGWGLGLSLAKRIVENYHKGKIFVKSSEMDKGTTFTIKLPKEL